MFCRYAVKYGPHLYACFPLGEMTFTVDPFGAKLDATIEHATTFLQELRKRTDIPQPELLAIARLTVDTRTLTHDEAQQLLAAQPLRAETLQ